MYATLRCDPKLFEKDLRGRLYVVTGANSVSGLATAEQLVRQGTHVVAACRRVTAGEDATRNLANERGSVVQCEVFSTQIPQNLGLVLDAEAPMKGTSEAYKQAGLSSSGQELGRAVFAALTTDSLERQWFLSRGKS